MPKARVSEKAEMRAPEGPPPTEGIAYSGEESEMPTGAMAESGTMGPIEESTMPLAGMGEPDGMPAGAPMGAVSVSGLPGAAGDPLAAAGMVAGPPGMATGGMGMGPSVHSGAGAEAEMPSGNMAFGDDMARVAMDPPTPGFGAPATQPGVGPATGQMPGTGEPAPPPGTGTTNGQMPGGGADPTSGTATGEMPGASASPSGSPTPTPGPGPTHPIVLSGTWRLSITIAASGHAADAPS